ncbi:MAG: hypothetical protein MJE68_32975 [Proteobacteria bacterium]|nr:hypothetical protein [Pseudomonadota bacterium]
MKEKRSGRGKGERARERERGGGGKGERDRGRERETNLIQFLFSFILNSPDVVHCQTIPLVQPAEHLPMEVAEKAWVHLNKRKTNQHNVLTTRYNKKYRSHHVATIGSRRNTNPTILVVVILRINSFDVVTSSTQATPTKHLNYHWHILY